MQNTGYCTCFVFLCTQCKDSTSINTLISHIWVVFVLFVNFPTRLVNSHDWPPNMGERVIWVPKLSSNERMWLLNGLNSWTTVHHSLSVWYMPINLAGRLWPSSTTALVVVVCYYSLLLGFKFRALSLDPGQVNWVLCIFTPVNFHSSRKEN